MWDDKDRVKAINDLIGYIAKRDHSEKELREKLSKNYSQDLVQEAIAHAEEQHWLGDPEELAQRVSESLHRKKKGYLYISSYLQEKGLPLRPCDDQRELEKGRQLVLSKFGNHSNLSYEEQQKAYKYLAYRGFEHEVIKKVIYEKP